MVVLLVATAITACSATPPSSVAAKNYDRKCASVADCVAVYEGHVGCCGGGGCPNTAIAQVAFAKYSVDLGLAASCGAGQPACPILDVIRPGDVCQGSSACNNGLCTLAMVPNDAATDE